LKLLKEIYMKKILFQKFVTAEINKVVLKSIGRRSINKNV